MKTLLFSLSIFLMSFAQAQASCGFQMFSQQDCCIRVVPFYEANATWYTIDFGDGNTVNGTFGLQPTSNVHEHCYTASGPYTVTITYYNQFAAVCGASNNITIDCPGDCTSYLCWEDFIGYFSTAQSVTIETPSGVAAVIPFANPVNTNAGYNAIVAELTAALASAGINVTVNSTGPQQDCTKGGISPTPGFFITDATKIISINGNGGSAYFNHDNCP